MWEVIKLLFLDDTALEGDSEKKSSAREFESVCKRRTIILNVEKSKMLRFSLRGKWKPLKAILDSKDIEVVREFKAVLSAFEGMEIELEHRRGKGATMMGGFLA